MQKNESLSDYKDLEDIAKIYRNTKNHIYSRFSGVASYNKLKDSRRNIRDVWTENDFIDNWSIPRRFVRNAIDDATTNIKTMWKQTKSKVKSEIGKTKLNDREKHFAYIMIKHDGFFYNIINKIKFDKITDFDDVNETKIYKTICRLVREHKPKISYTNKLTMKLDEQMYSYEGDKLCIASKVKGKRLKFKVNTEVKFKGDITIVLENDRMSISKAIDTKIKSIVYVNDRIGIDKNYKNLIDTNNENSYGVGFSELVDNLSDKLHEKNKKRQTYHEQIKELEDKGNLTVKEKKKIFNIRKFNLGKVKYNNKKRKLQETTKKFINKAVKDMISFEKPMEIAKEKLNFNGKRKYNKKVNRHLSTWQKGYLDERIDYISSIKGIKTIPCNAAYTSQECPKCHAFGVKLNDIFYCSNTNCVYGGGVHSGHCSAKVVLNRSYDKDITLDMSSYKVKETLLKRLGELKTDSTQTCCVTTTGANYPKTNQNKPNSFNT